MANFVHFVRSPGDLDFSDVGLVALARIGTRLCACSKTGFHVVLAGCNGVAAKILHAISERGMARVVGTELH